MVGIDATLSIGELRSEVAVLFVRRRDGTVRRRVAANQTGVPAVSAAAPGPRAME
ncbi:MAG: hypothetical protein ACT4NP_12150 [Pseudonocardiales bacterium]